MWTDETWNFFVALLIVIGVILGVAGTSLALTLYWWLT